MQKNEEKGGKHNLTCHCTQIKYHYLKEMDPGKLLEKLQ